MASTIFLLCAIAPSAFGQASVYGSLSGRVTDPSGAAVVGASVTVTETSIQVDRETTTDASGRYLFPRLRPGAYRLLVSTEGFQATSVSGINVAVNAAPLVDVTLAIGAVTETVEVAATTQPVQTEGAQLSLLIDANRIADLPLNGRDFADLTLLSPGFGAPEPFEGKMTASVSGGRGRFNGYNLDGMTNSDERTGGGSSLLGGAAGLASTAPNVISTEAIREFRVISANADATFGRGSGGQINIITKSGSNSVHGSLYHYLRNDKLDARDYFNYGPFFNDRGEAVPPPFKQNLFGGSIGGPIVKNKHFFFGNYEGFRQRLQQTGTFTAPNRELIELMPGNLGQFYRAFYLDRGVVTGTTSPGQFVPLTAAQRQAAVDAGFTPSLFDGNPANGEAGTLVLSTAPTVNVDQDSFLVRTDHNFSDRLQVNLRYGWAGPSQTTSVGLPIDLRDTNQFWQSGAAEVVYTISPNQILEFRGGVLRSNWEQSPAGGVPAAFTNVGVSERFGVIVQPQATPLTRTELLGTAGFSDRQTTPQFAGMHSWTNGSLTLRTGADVTFFGVDINNGAGRPGYNFNGFVGPTGMLGPGPGAAQAVAASASASLFGFGGSPDTALRNFSSHRQEYFAQADWKATRTLTLNLGMRYSYFGVYRETNNAVSNLYAVDGSGNPVPDVSPFAFGRTANDLFQASSSLPLYQPTRNNFQPRIGAAWNLGGRNKTVLRGGYGLFNDRLYQLMFSAQGGLVNNPPFTLATSAPDVPFILREQLPLNTPIPSVTGIDPTIRDPRVHRVNATIEQSLDSATTISASFVGTYGRGLFGSEEVNGGAQTPLAARPDPRFTVQRLIGNPSSSDYNALQIFANRRMQGGLTFTGAYTYADFKDDNSSEVFATFTGLVNRTANPAPGFQGGDWAPRPRSADWGDSGGRIAHTFTFSQVWELPFGRGRRFMQSASPLAEGVLGGWSVSGIGTWRTGNQVDLRLGTDANDDGDPRDRPGLLSGSLDDLYQSGGDKTQFLVPQSQASQILGIPTPITDPFAAVRRNALAGPSVFNYDLSLAKRFYVTERANVRFEANFFNVFNNAKLASPSASVASALFGRITSTVFGSTPRQIQLGLRVAF
jgi:hypothetical protein